MTHTRSTFSLKQPIYLFFINARLNKRRQIYSILKHTFSKYVLRWFSYPTIFEVYCRGNFTVKITMHVLKQFFLIMIFNIHHKLFLVAMFINSTFLYYDLVLEDWLDEILASLKVWITLYHYDSELTLFNKFNANFSTPTFTFPTCAKNK